MKQKGLPMGDDTDKTVKILAYSITMIVVFSILLLYFIVTKDNNIPGYMGTPMSEDLYRDHPADRVKPSPIPVRPSTEQMDRTLERCFRRGTDSCILELDSSASMRKHLV